MADPRPITGSAGHTITAVDGSVEIRLRFDEHCGLELVQHQGGLKTSSRYSALRQRFPRRDEAAQGDAMTWQPIDTARKHNGAGSEVLLYNGENVYIGHWWDGWQPDGGYNHDEDESMFTHWMPLPDPPAAVAPVACPHAPDWRRCCVADCTGVTP